MKKTISIFALLAALLSSCAVQQFQVNTKTQSFQYGGAAFGEKTKGKEVKKSADLMILGINIHSADTKKMAEGINAASYTIETKFSFISALVHYGTAGLIDWKTVKVIKREN